MFPKSLLKTFPLFCRCSSSSKILPVFSKNCIFEPVQVSYQSFVSTAEYGTLHNRYIVSALKIMIYDNIICFCLQTSEMYETVDII